MQTQNRVICPKCSRYFPIQNLRLHQKVCRAASTVKKFRQETLQKPIRQLQARQDPLLKLKLQRDKKDINNTYYNQNTTKVLLKRQRNNQKTTKNQQYLNYRRSDKDKNQRNMQEGFNKVEQKVKKFMSSRDQISSNLQQRKVQYKREKIKDQGQVINKISEIRDVIPQERQIEPKFKRTNKIINPQPQYFPQPSIRIEQQVNSQPVHGPQLVHRSQILHVQQTRAPQPLPEPEPQPEFKCITCRFQTNSKQMKQVHDWKYHQNSKYHQNNTQTIFSQNNNYQTCPTCLKEINKNYYRSHQEKCPRSFQLLRNKYIQRQLRQYQEQNQLRPCHVCKQEILRVQMHSHYPDCINLYPICNQCNVNIPYRILPAHRQKCNGDSVGSAHQISLYIDQQIRRRQEMRRQREQRQLQIQRQRLQRQERTRALNYNHIGLNFGNRGFPPQYINGLPKRKMPQLINEQEHCLICLGDYTASEEVNVLKCEHYYHVQCLGKWLRLNRSCPACRRVAA